MSSIARQIDRSTSTVTREVKNNGGRDDYRIWRSHQRARECTKRPKDAKLDEPVLCTKVTEWLEEFWSPKEIARRLVLDFPDDPSMRISHETIYQSLFVQGRGELRRELARCLRSGRTKRRPQGFVDKRGKIADMVMISDRPAEIEHRAVPGHWESDLIIGENHASAVGTLVERSTRFVMLLHLGKDYSAKAVEIAMRKAIATLPDELMRSVTWDQGSEMTNHRSITVATGVPIYFCDPHSPWQRGSKENTNGLLRQYMPKSTDRSKYSVQDLMRIQRSLNGQPRATLGYGMPVEKLAELAAQTP
jgi:IS30 family transposase